MRKNNISIVCTGSCICHIPSCDCAAKI